MAVMADTNSDACVDDNNEYLFGMCCFSNVGRLEESLTTIRPDGGKHANLQANTRAPSSGHNQN